MAVDVRGAVICFLYILLVHFFFVRFCNRVRNEFVGVSGRALLCLESILRRKFAGVYVIEYYCGCDHIRKIAAQAIRSAKRIFVGRSKNEETATEP